jgi:clorobiocin biosynthesis protein CloN7
MTTMSTTVEVPGAQLHYQVSGSGPVLLLSGASSSAYYQAMASLLAQYYTVVTYDTRGITYSTREDVDVDISVAVQADDLHRLLGAVSAESAFIMANSGGAIFCLELLLRHPQQVRVVIAHEPPLLEVLPDSARQHAAIAAVHQAYRAGGADAAWPMFLSHTGMDGAADAEPVDALDPETQAAMAGDGDVFLGHMIVPTTGHHFDIDALRERSSSIVVAAGTASVGQLGHRTATVLAGLLGSTLVDVPGGHLGFADHPRAFAARVRHILNGVEES